MVEVDLVDGSRRETAVLGTTPGPPGDLKAELSADGTAAVLVDLPSRSAAFADLDTGRAVPLENPTDDPATFFEFRALPAGAALLGSDGTVTLYDTGGRIRQQFDALPGAAIDLDVAPDGTWGVTVGGESAVVLWDIDAATGRWSEKEVLTGAGGVVGTAMIDPSGEPDVHPVQQRHADGLGRGAAAAVSARPVRGWTTGGSPTSRPSWRRGSWSSSPTRPFGSAVSGDWPYFGPGTSEVAATFVDPRTGEVVDEVAVGDTLEESYIGASVAVSPDRGLIAVSSGLAVTVLDARSREPVTTFPVPAAGYPGPDGQPLPVGVVGCLAWTADGSRLLLGVQGGDPATIAARRNPARRRHGELGDRRRSDGGRRAGGARAQPGRPEPGAGGGWNTVLEIRDAATLDERSTVDLGSDGPGSGTCPGRRTASCCSPSARAADCRWSTRTRGRPSAPAFASDSSRLQIEWLPDGRTVALTGAGSTVRLFDVDRSVAPSGLPAAVGNVQTQSFMVPDPTGDLVILGDQDWVMRYPMTPSAWLRTACEIAGRDLTRAEWDLYLAGRAYRSTCTDLE